MTDVVDCPCRTGKPYEACCGPVHSGRRPAASAVALMRSRYTAFALGLSDYLYKSWHPSTRPADLSLDPDLEWTGLVIERTTAGKAWDDTGEVRFAAEWRSGSDSGVLRETSRFAFVGRAWVYVDGFVHS